MDELAIGDKIYISTKRAASITGYAKDYVGQLCREGRVEAKLVGRSWYVLEASIREHRFGVETAPEAGSVTGMVSETEIVDPHMPPEAPELPQEETSTWSAPIYEVEVPTTIPEIMTKEVEVATEVEVFATPEENLPAAVDQEPVAEMQNAWKAWFETRHHEPINVMETSEPTREDFIQKSSQNIDKSEEIERSAPRVEIRPRFEAEPLPVMRKPVAYDIYPAPRGAPIEHEPTRVIHERRRSSGKGISRTLVVSICIGVALLAVAVTIIASGSASLVGGTAVKYSPIIEFFEGKNILQKEIE